MAVTAYKGAFTDSDTVISTPGVDPLVIFFFAGYNTADGLTDGPGRFSYGYAAKDGATLTQGYLAVHQLDGNTAALDARGQNTTACLKGLIAAASAVTVDYELDISAMGTGDFTVTWTDPPATSGMRVQFLALGSSDGTTITGARVGSFTPSGAGPQNVTVNAGFGKPQIVFGSLIGNTSSLGDQAEDMWLNLGVDDTAGKGYSVLFDQDAAGNADPRTAQVTTSMIRSYGATSFGLEFDASLTTSKASWPTDGFQLTFADAPDASNPVVYLAIKGSLSTSVGAANTATTLSDVDYDAGFAPAAALTFGFGMPASASTYTADSGSAQLAAWGMGATDGTREGCAGVTTDDGTANMATGQWHSETKVWQSVNPGTTPTLVGEADSSFSGNNVRFSWTDADAVARQHIVVAFGPAAAAAEEIPLLVMAPSRAT